MTTVRHGENDSQLTCMLLTVKYWCCQLILLGCSRDIQAGAIRTKPDGQLVWTSGLQIQHMQHNQKRNYQQSQLVNLRIPVAHPD